MSTRILFADDSMTAQNMGKKILTDAGYEVVAVSNGAAAVKKIAEHKPDIIILDIYMPGYSGLEVCDKVRASVETLKIPVLLTVGKMEPYRAEDANRVKADGVIIKPFEASDLLAVIKKLEERVTPKTVAMAEDTILLERPPEFAEFTTQPSENHTEAHVYPTENTVQATVDVPDNMATSAAFSDLLGMEPAHSVEPLPLPRHTPAAELPVSAELPVEPPAEAVEFTSLESDEFTVVRPSHEESAGAGELEATTPSHATAARAGDPGVEEAQSAFAASSSFGATEAEELSETAASSLPDTQPIPVYREPQPGNAVVADIPPSATREDAEDAGTREVHSFKEPEHSVVLAAATAPAPEPLPSVLESGSGKDEAGVDSFSAKIEAQIQQIETIVSASEARHLEAEAKPPVENGFEHAALSKEVAPSADDDFEARVAAAMSIYDDPAEDKIGPASTAMDEVKPIAHAAEITREAAPEPASFDAPYSFEYSPPVNAPEAETSFEPKQLEEKTEPVIEASQPVEPPASAEQVVETKKPAERPVSSRKEVSHTWERHDAALPESSRVDDEKIISEIEAQLPAAAVTAVDPGADTQRIAAVVHRVLERLKPQLIEEISRELKSKK